MAENLLQTVQDMLKEEAWTRATISNYTQNELKDLANIVEQARNENCVDEILEICTEHLSHTKDSIIALFLNGIFSLQRNSIDNSSLETLVDIFQKNHKEQIVNYLCEFILEDYPDNKFALKTLGETYFAEGNDKAWDIFIQLTKKDRSDSDHTKILAEHFESINDLDNAKEYYKKTEYRLINNENYNGAKEIWSKLVQLMPEEIDCFWSISRRIAKQFGEIKTTTLMQELYNWYKDNAKWDIAIQILKHNLEIEPKDNWARKELVDCYKNKYASHSHLEDYIKSSNLSQSYRNVFEAINDFEKHIAFDKGSFVFHRNWGVGIIKKLENENLTINFGSKAGIHEISLKMAVTALKPLPKDHIWVKKATTKDIKALKNDVKKNQTEWLKIIIKSFDNHCDFKRIKAELVPAILTPGEWTSWNTSAKKELDTNAIFGVDPNDINIYTVRDHEITIEEKLNNEFKAQKQFFARVDIIMKFINNEDTDTNSEAFTEMYDYFKGFLKNISKVNEQTIASYLVVKKIGTIDKNLAFQIKETFAELYSRIEDVRETYENLKDTKNTSLKADFIECIKMLPDWNKEYLKLFPEILDQRIIDDLINNGFTNDVQKFVRDCYDSYRDYRETVLFFFKNCQKMDWYEGANVPYEKQLITLINIIELANREINNHVNSTENKKIINNASALLFSKEAVFDYMFKNDENTVKKIYTLIDDNAGIDLTYKAQTRNKILEKYPEFKFRVSEEKSQQPKGMIVTAKKLTEKKAEAEQIQNVEIPRNANDVAEAKAKGDLKENQEYKAAKEEQHFLGLRLAKLQEELNRAVVFDPTTVTTALVSFGTVVTLHNNDTNKDEVYTILGPWESDPENNVISYMSPFGNEIIDRKLGEDIKNTVNGRAFNYTVKDIKKADI